MINYVYEKGGVPMNKKERTRLRIAEALLSLLKNSPIQDIYIVDLIEEAEISKRTFYNYFSDKHDVFSWWWKHQMTPYVGGSILEYSKKEMILLKEYGPCFLNVLSYTGQNNFLEDAIAFDIDVLRTHIRRDILEKHTMVSALSGVEFTAKSAWNFFGQLLEDAELLDGCIASLDVDPDSIVLAGSLSIIVPYYSYPALPEGEHI